MLCCRQSEENAPDHKGYIEHALAGRLFKAQDSTAFHRFVDSAYNALPTKSLNDRLDKYDELGLFWYLSVRNNGQALLYADSLLDAVKPKRNVPAYASRYINALFRKGDILLALNRYEDAFSWYYQARELVLQQKDTCSFPEHTNRLAMVSFKQKKFGEAIVYYKQAYEELQHCALDSFEHFGDIQGNLDNTGIAYNRLGKADSAAFYFNKALAYINEKENSFPSHKDFMPIAKAVIYGNLAEAEMQLGHFTQAESLLLKGISINEDPARAPEDAAYSMSKLVRLYLDQHRNNEAGNMLSRLAVIEADFPNTELSSRYLFLRSRYEMAIGHSTEAYEFLSKQTRMRDSLERLLTAEPVADVRRTFEQIGNQYRLETQNRLKTEFLLLIAVFFVMVLMILLLQWKNYRRTKRNIEALHTLNEEVLQKNEYLLTTLEALEKSRRDKHHLLKVVAHDLRGPVSSMAAIARMVHKGQFEAGRVPEAMNMIARSGNSAMELINELLDYRSLESKQNTEILDLSELLRYCVDVLKHKAGEKQQVILLQPEHANILADREKILRIFHNLLDNAIKFSEPRNIITITMQCTDTKVKVSVIDHGIGIPAVLQNSIFNEPVAASQKGTDGEASFGLGLSIVAQLVKEHKGKIWYTSEEGNGTTFFLEFPLAK